MARKKRSFGPVKRPEFLLKIEEKIIAFLDWIAPVVDWVGDQAEKYKAASDAVPPPSKKWVHKRRINTGKATVTVFLAFLTIMTLVALYLPNRPSWSDLEQRELTRFPKPTVVRVLNGRFFDDVNTWFADTFPMREKFLAAHSKLESYYGFRSRKVVGQVSAGDDIPEAGKNQNTTPENEEEPAVLPPETDPGDSVTPTDDGGESSDTSSVQSEEPDVSQQAQEKEEISDEDVETLGALLVIKDTAYEYYNFVQSTADSYIDLVNQAAKQLKGKAKVYDMVVPTSMDVCVPEKIRKKSNTSDQGAAINYIYSSLSDVATVDLLENLRSHQEEKEYLYFRTDHHWTALGAYYAYAAFAPLAGKEAASLDAFNEYVFENFIGSFYRETESSAMAANPDTVYAYGPKATNTMQITLPDGTEITHNIIQDGDDLAKSLKYISFIGGDNPFSVIENPDITDGSAIMLVKESFGNCFAPFLVQNYQYVYVVDYRYIDDVDERKLSQMVEDYQVDDVLFLNNIGATREEKLVKQMAAFVG